MANTRFGYVRDFEEDDPCLPNTFMVVRLDGRGFTKFCLLHDFEKPNDPRALNLMNLAAEQVCKEFPEIFIAFGQSDEYSFCFKRDSKAYNRRRSKILSTIVSLFSATYAVHWAAYMGSNTLLKSIPVFDGRIVLYPSLDNVMDYFRWRQADCHINNLYNTAFWSLVKKGGRSEQEAEKDLNGTVSKEKHELLFTKFGINYNEEPAMYRKGSVILRVPLSSFTGDASKVEDCNIDSQSKEGTVTSNENTDEFESLSARKRKKWTEKRMKDLLKGPPAIHHVDIMKEEFWSIFQSGVV